MKLNKQSIDSLERILARSTSHYMGKNDFDAPTVPILTQREARISLMLRLSWILSNFIVFFAIIINIIHHW